MIVQHGSRASNNNVLHPPTSRKGLIIKTLSNITFLCPAMIFLPPPLLWTLVYSSLFENTIIQNEIKRAMITKWRDHCDRSLLDSSWNVSHFTSSSSFIPPWSSAQVSPSPENILQLPLMSTFLEFELCSQSVPPSLKLIDIMAPLYISYEFLILPCLVVSASCLYNNWP